MTARTYALGIEYCGTTFNGWQVQPDRPSVQAALEEALSNFADHPVSVICAGRTDAGVHAMHQVVSFSSEAKRAPEGWVRGVNGFSRKPSPCGGRDAWRTTSMRAFPRARAPTNTGSAMTR